MKIIDSRLTRTLEDLSDYNFQLQYTPGGDNAAADALSRLYHPDNVNPTDPVEIDSGCLPDGLLMLQKLEGGGNSLFASLHLLTQSSSCGNLQLNHLISYVKCWLIIFCTNLNCISLSLIVRAGRN